MNILCHLFGHRPRFGYGHGEGEGYFRVTLGPVDGIGVHHANLHCDCQRCDTNYKVGMIHVPRIPDGGRNFDAAVEKVIDFVDERLPKA